MSEPVRVAMWSGPRNISTALMRSWGARADTAVLDEPFYAAYLAATGAPHPGRDDVLAAQPTDWRTVVADVTGPVPGDRPIWYQKHMAQHMLPEIGRGWMTGFRHAFLIRDPRETLLSFSRVIEKPRVEETGLPQQVELFDWVADHDGAEPPVIDARDVLEDPEAQLRALCAALDVEWDPAMLEWEAGPRETDGAWARHWYSGVEKSTGFQPYREREGTLDDELAAVHEQCLPLYRKLHDRRIRT